MPPPQGTASAQPPRRSRADLEAELAAAEDKSHADNTKSTYVSALRVFTAFCQQYEYTPIIPTDTHTLGLFAADQALLGMAPSTITTRCSAIRSIHRRPQLAGLPKPPRPYVPPELVEAEDVVRKHRKALAKKGWTPRQAEAMLLADLKKIKATMRFDRGIDVRDWAILTLAFALGARRSEMSCLNIGDIAIDPDDPQWMMVRICFSKTDQDAAGQVIMIKRANDHTVCPVAAVFALITFLRMRGVTSGPLIRQMAGYGDMLSTHGKAIHPDALEGRLSPKSITRVFSRRSLAAEIPAENPDGMPGFASRMKRFTGHSGRRGGATEAARKGATHTQLCDHFRWVRGSKMAELYIQKADQKTNNVMAAVM